MLKSTMVWIWFTFEMMSLTMSVISRGVIALDGKTKLLEVELGVGEKKIVVGVVFGVVVGFVTLRVVTLFVGLTTALNASRKFNQSLLETGWGF